MTCPVPLPLAVSASDAVVMIGVASVQLAIVAALAWVVTTALPDRFARLRHAVWLVVLAKCLLPPIGPAAPWSPLRLLPSIASLDSVAAVPVEADASPPADPRDTMTPPRLGGRQPTVEPSERLASPATIALIVWFVGVVLVYGVSLWRSRRLLAQIAATGTPIDEGPAAIALEEARERLGIETEIDLVAVPGSSTPFVTGLRQPTIVLPQSVLDSLSPASLRLVVWHEATHIAKRDLWTGLLATAAVGLFWFHPAAWLAAARVRSEREAVCDQTVIATCGCQPSDYGDTFLGVLRAARAQSLSGPALAAPIGVFERHSNLRARLETIMTYRPEPTRRGITLATAAAFALVAIPLGSPQAADAKTGPPQIVSIHPEPGSDAVDPALDAISVTFDRPMDTAGYSWTGGGKTFPPQPDGQTAIWSDDGRTCRLPVALKPNAAYRVGINSKSFTNFRSADGVPVQPRQIAFETAESTEAAIQARQDRDGATIILDDDFLPSDGSVPEGWSQRTAPGVELAFETKDGNDGYFRLTRTNDRFFPIASWKRRVERTGDAEYVQFVAQVAAKKARKGVLDVLFLDADGEWIKHQWVHYIGEKESGDQPADFDFQLVGGVAKIPEGTVSMEFSVQIYGKGELLVDGVLATYVTAEQVEHAMKKAKVETAE